MTIDTAIDLLGDQTVLALGGAVIGVGFGVFAQRSRFCLHAASVEVSRGILGKSLAIWLLVFSTAMIATQALYLLGWFDSGNVRQLNNRGSLSGAIIGGLLFGCGMTLTRACVSRMLVLSSTGNLRAVLSALVFACVAQASRDGLLSPIRMALSSVWTLDGNDRDLLSMTGAGHGGGVLFGCLWMVAAISIAIRHRMSMWRCVIGAAVGLMVAAAWWFNYAVSTTSFEMVPVHSLSFTAPSSDILMFVLSPPGSKFTFDLGLIPGVVVGSFLAAAWARELWLERLQSGPSIMRSMLGGAMMGFGGVMAGGCEVGAGVSGASIFVVTSWVVLGCMWISAMVTDRMFGRRTIVKL